MFIFAIINSTKQRVKVNKMGWSGCPNDGSYKTNKSFYNDVLRNSWNSNVTVLDVAFVGKNIYELLKLKKEDGEEEIFINLVLIERRRAKDGYSAYIDYKHVSESMGPTLHDCPVKFLKQSTCQSEYAVEWRKRCYEYREESKKYKQKIEDVYKKLPRGAIIETFGGTKLQLAYHYTKTKFAAYMLEGEDTETLYSWKYTAIKDVVEQKEVESA